MIRPATIVCATLTAAAFGIACGETASPIQSVRLVSLALPDVPSDALLRPNGISVDPRDGLLVVVEEGRLSLTWLDPDSGALTERRSLWPRQLPDRTTSRGGTALGGPLVRSDDGFWTLSTGLGPIFVPDAPARAPTILGRGSGGEPAAPGVTAGNADLSQTRGLAVDNQQRLVLAVDDQLLRLQSGRLIALSEDLDLILGSAVGVAACPETGSIYVTDAGSGIVWSVDVRGRASAIAGGGETLTAPSDPVPADSIALELGQDHLALSPDGRELSLLTRGALFVIDLLAEPSPTIRSLPTGARDESGLAVGAESHFVTVLNGQVRRVDDAGSEALRPALVDGLLGRATAVTRVGTSSLLIVDPGLRRLSAWVDTPELVPFWVELSPSLPTSQPVAADAMGHVYLQTVRGLRGFDIQASMSFLIGQPTARPFVEGQRLESVRLPDDAELRAGGGDGALFLLDEARRLVMRVDATDGSVSLAAGTFSGGGWPRDDVSVRADLLALRSPRRLVTSNDALLLVDDAPGGDAVVYGVGLSDVAPRLAGRTLERDRAWHLGGDGGMPYEDGAAFADTEVADVRALAIRGDDLIASVDDPDAPSVIVVDVQGVMAPLSLSPPRPPDALAAFGDVLLAGWRDSGDVVALNLGDEAVEAFGETIEPASQIAIETGEPGIADVIASPASTLALSTDGRLVDLDRLDRDEVVAPAAGRTIALRVDGGALWIEDAALHGVAAVDGALLFGDALAAPPGAELVPALEGFPSDARLGNFAFSSNVAALTLDATSRLHWLDWQAQALYRAQPPDDGLLEPTSTVTRLAIGPPLPEDDTPAALVVSPDGEVLVAHSGVVRRLRDGDWHVVAGGGPSDSGEGIAATAVALSSISGLAFDGDELVLRARQGLLWIAPDGLIRRSVAELGTDVGDGPMVAFAQSLTFLDGAPVVSLGGGVYRVLGASDPL